MIESESDYKLRINGVLVPTLSVDEGEYYTAFPIADRALSIAVVELLNPSGETIHRFGFTHCFAVPKGEEGIFTVFEDVDGDYAITYHVCGSPDCAEERRDMFMWDATRCQLRAANYIGGETMFQEEAPL